MKRHWKKKGQPRQPNRSFTAPDGTRWHSRGEYGRWLVLKDMEARGELRNLERQVRIDLQGRNGTIRARKSRRARQMVWDFRYFQNNQTVYEDWKGHPEEIWEFKADVFANAFPNVVIRISSRKGVK